MAFVSATNTTGEGFVKSAFARFSNGASRFVDWLVMIGENSARMKRLAYYQAMTDEQLAERGLKRDQIVHHVFSDILGI